MELKLYTIVTASFLDTVLPDSLCEILGYENGAILRDKLLSYSELVDGTFVISVNLCTPGSKCAKTGLNTQEVIIAEQNYGKENLLTVDQYRELEFKEYLEI